MTKILVKIAQQKVLANPRVKDLMARLNHNHSFEYCFGNEKVAEDLQRYLSLNSDKSQSAPLRTLRPSEAITQGAKKTAEAMERVRQEKERQAEEQLAKCDEDARERMSRLGICENLEAMVIYIYTLGPFRTLTLLL